MTTPQITPNPATRTRPTRSSQRVAHKKPLGWLPWLLLLLLLLLLALVGYAVSQADDNSDVAAQPASTAAANPDPNTTTSGGGAGAGAGAASGAAGNAVAAAAAGALVGGAGIPPSAAKAGTAAGGSGGARAAGTAGTVLFAEGSAAIDANGKKVIATAAVNLKRAGASKVAVIGYTDVVAGAPVNGPLSQQRADAVASTLRADLPGLAVTSSAKGQSEPIAPNGTPQGRQQNRRAAIIAQG